jgi:glycine dehydrogenase
VRRIDGVHGDRNLICSCPAPQEFEKYSAATSLTDTAEAFA